MRFDEKAESYNQYAVVQRSLLDWAEDWLEPNLSQMSCIEFGAGTGLFTERLLNRRAALMATDIAAGMVAVGKRNSPHAVWRELDAWAVNGGSFDRLYSSSLLQWAPDPVDVFKNWLQMANTGGRMFNVFYVAPSLTEIEEILPGSTPLKWHTADYWTNACEKAGWRVLRAENQQRRFVFPSAQALFRGLHGIGATRVNQTPPSILKTALKEYNRLYEEADGVRATWTFYRVESEKL